MDKNQKNENPFPSDLAPLTEFNLSVLTQSKFCDKKTISLILAMSVAYNDLKDVLIIHRMLNSHFPENRTEITSLRGQMSGMSNTCFKNILSICWEFVELLGRNNELLGSKFLKFAEMHLPDSEKQIWNELKELSRNKNKFESKHGRDLRVIQIIRDNLGFHYYGIDNFTHGIEEYAKNVDRPSVYASFGSDMEGSRFYYADAAIEFEIHYILKKYGTNEVKVLKVAQLLNRSVRLLIQAFLTNHEQAANASREESREMERFLKKL